MRGSFSGRPRDKFPSIVFSAHKIMETKEDWARRSAQETEGNFTRTHGERGERDLWRGGVAEIPVAWQGVEAAADDLAARVKVKRWPPPAALIPTTQPAHQLHGHSDQLTPLLFLVAIFCFGLFPSTS